jgi:hypothetical protein
MSKGLVPYAVEEPLPGMGMRAAGQTAPPPAVPVIGAPPAPPLTKEQDRQAHQKFAEKIEGAIRSLRFKGNSPEQIDELDSVLRQYVPPILSYVANSRIPVVKAALENLIDPRFHKAVRALHLERWGRSVTEARKLQTDFMICSDRSERAARAQEALDIFHRECNT